MVDTPGGGLCQLSSTIYNSALLSGMEIIERSPHLWKIKSVGPGLDAAIYLEKTGQIDLRFKNPYDFPVKIKCDIRNKRLFVRFMASHKPRRAVTVQVETLQVYPAPLYPRVPNSNGGSENSLFKGTDGCKVKVYRTFTEKGQVVRREVVSVDRYEPVPGSHTQ